MTVEESLNIQNLVAIAKVAAEIGQQFRLLATAGENPVWGDVSWIEIPA